MYSSENQREISVYFSKALNIAKIMKSCLDIIIIYTYICLSKNGNDSGSAGRPFKIRR